MQQFNQIYYFIFI